MRSVVTVLALGACSLPEFPGDADGDGVPDTLDCFPDDAEQSTLQAWPDQDHDGFGSGAGATVDGCEIAEGSADNDHDCDDGDAEILDHRSVWTDADHDGFGGTFLRDDYTCVVGADETTRDGDCDDASASVTDHVEGYLDADGDGHGVGGPVPAEGCDPGDLAPVADDCDDGDPHTPSDADLCYTAVDETCGLAPVGACRLENSIPPRSVSDTPDGYLAKFPTRRGDFDGDGILDVFSGTFRDQSNSGDDLGLLLYGSGSTATGWGTPKQLVVDDAVSHAGAVRGVFLDWDGDQQDDLAVLDHNPSDAVDADLWLLRGGTARIGAQKTLGDTVDAVTAHVVIANSAVERFGPSMAAGDLDGDGRDELVITGGADLGAGRDSIYVFRGGGIGFGTSATMSHGSIERIREPKGYVFDDGLGESVVYVPDVDGAGTVALSLTTLGSSQDRSEVRVLDATLLVAGTTTTQASLYDARSPDTWGGVQYAATPQTAWADLDGDGLPDLVFSTPSGVNTGSGRAFVDLAPSLGATDDVDISRIADAVLEPTGGATDTYNCGAGLAAIPDLLGPGTVGVAIACPDMHGGGKTYVFPGDALTGTLSLQDDHLAVVEGATYGAALALGNSAVDGGGDLDGDGQVDLLMSEGGNGRALFHFASGGVLDP